MCVQLLGGCEACEIKHFFNQDEKESHLRSARHKAHQLVRKRQVSYTGGSPTGPDEDLGNVLSRFRHLTLLSRHFCLDCGTTVVSSDLSSLETVSLDLKAHLLSKEHKHIQFLVSDSNAFQESIGQLPLKSIALSDSRFVCFACIPFKEFSSFLSVCEHSALSHVEPLISRKRKAHEDGFSSPLPGFMKENEDGMSRTCTLCDVVVWSDDDPHLLGKRHRKAMHYYKVS